MNSPAVIRHKDGAFATDHERYVDGLVVPAGTAINEVLAHWNREALDAMTWIGALDYSGYIQMLGPWGAYDRELPRPQCFRINVTHPLIVAKYLESSLIGTFYDRSRHISDVRRQYPIKRLTVTQEDRMALLTRTSFDTRTTATAKVARTRFAEATRSAAFSLTLGIREIRLLAQQIWDLDIASEHWATLNWLPVGDVAAFQRLIDKGLVIHERGQKPRLSSAGTLTRALLVESNHIVEAAPDDDPIVL